MNQKKPREQSSDPLPYTQVDRAVLPIAATLAGAIDVSRQHALGSLIEFWSLNGDPRTIERLIGEGKSEVVKSGEEIRRVFKLASGKTLEPDAMVDLGLLEKKGENVFRVRGMSRYFEPIKARLEARARASAAGKASAASRQDVRGTAQPMFGNGFESGSTATEQPPNSRRTPPNQRSAVSGQRSEDSSKRPDRSLAGNTEKQRRTPAQPDLPGTPPPTPKPPREPSEQEEAYRWFEFARRDHLTDVLQVDFEPDERPAPAFLNTALRPVLDFTKPYDQGEGEERTTGFERLVDLYLEQEWAAKKSPPFPFASFVGGLKDRSSLHPGGAPMPGLLSIFRDRYSYLLPAPPTGEPA